MIEITLEEDIYSIGFVTFLRFDSPKRHERMVQKCIWTFVFQIVLLILLARHWGQDEDHVVSLENIIENIELGSTSLNLTRLVCALLMHISILPDIISAKEMLSFAKKNVTSFSG